MADNIDIPSDDEVMPPALAEDNNESSDSEDEASEREENLLNIHNQKRASKRIYKALSDTYRRDTEALLESFGKNLAERRKNAEMTEIMKRISVLIQEAFEEYLAVHRDPAEDILTSRSADSPKLHFIWERLNKIMLPTMEELLERLCRDYIRDGYEDPDMQYYAALILYTVVQGISSSSEEAAEYFHVFFAHEDIFIPLVHLMSVDPPVSSALRQPTRNATEIRALICGIYGTCFDRIVIEQFKEKIQTVRGVVPGHFKRLREYLRSLVPTFSASDFAPKFSVADTQAEPDPAAPSPFMSPPPAANLKSSQKRRLERTKSVGDPSSTITPRRKRQKLVQASVQSALNIDESSSCSSWAEYERMQIGSVAANFRVLPMDENLEIRLILDFLVGLATLDEFSSLFYELDALKLCYEFLDVRKRINVRILGQMINFLANLLFHDRFVIKFLEVPIRLTQLIKIPYPSIPSVFVVKALKNIVVCSSSEYFALETMIKYPELVHNVTAIMVESGLKSGHESARKWAASFFSQALEFRMFMEAFDDPKVDGLRTLLNEIRRYEYFWKPKGKLERAFSTVEQILSASEAFTSAMQALICYFTTDMVLKAESFRQDLIRRARETGKEPPSDHKFPRIVMNKAIRLEKNELDEVREFMLTMVPLCRAPRDGVSRFVDLEGIQRLLQILEVEQVERWDELTNFSIVPYHKMALEIMEKCVLSRRAQDVIADYQTTNELYPFSGFGLLIKLAVKYVHEITEVKKMALHVIANSVYGMRTGRSAEELEVPNTARKGASRAFSNDPQHFERIVTLLRQQKCIADMVRIMDEAELPESEGLRALACKVLVGMAGSESCRQVLKELTFFRTGELQVLLREPLGIDRHDGDFAKFGKYATELLELIYETTVKVPIPVDLTDRVAKQNILKKTRITFSSQEIDLLLLGHLESRGLTNTAQCLVEEVGLKTESTSASAKPHKTRLSITPGIVKTAPAMLVSATTGDPAPTVSSGPKNYILDATDAPVTINGLPNLVGIVANNFRAQHAQCEHPIALCAPFTLKKKHRCPAPTRVTLPPNNIHLRSLVRGGLPGGQFFGRTLDRHHIFSRFKQTGHFTLPVDQGVFDSRDGMISAAFVGQRQNTVAMGSPDGHIACYSLNDLSKPLFSKACHDAGCETYHLMSFPGRSDTFVSTCTTEVSTLWKLSANNSTCSVLKQYDQVDYMDFQHLGNHLAVGTHVDDAFILDLETGERVLSFQHSKLQGHYARNRPSFDPSDDLITHDGLLFDARSGKLVHKFDQIERHTQNGVFHPDGNVIIIDCEVWDLRNFRLRRSVSQFRRSFLKFNFTGDIIYALRFPDDIDEIDTATATEYPGTFSTVDSREYTTIAGFDLKRKFHAMALDTLDRYVVFAEPYNETFDSYGRLFEIGLDKGDQELEDDGEEGENDFNSSDDDDDDEDLDDYIDFDMDDDVIDDWDEHNDELGELEGNEDDEDFPAHSSDEWTTDEEIEGSDEEDDDFVYELE